MPGMEVTRAAKKSIEDILTWVQCFTTVIAILSTKFPEAVPDLMAYMLSIIWAYQEYEHPKWCNYDEAFRDKAATTGNQKWSVIDSHLYNQTFTGRARKLPVCTHCRASTHHTEGCPSSGAPAQKMFTGDIVGTGSLQKPTPRVARGLGEAAKMDVCWGFNAGHCKYASTCKFRHMCSFCSGHYPEASWPRKAGETSKMLVHQHPYAATSFRSK